MRLQQYEKVLAQLAEELQHYLISRGAQEDVAEDIVQDVFVKLLEMELILPPDKLRPYTYRVAWSTYLDHYRRVQRYQDLVRKYLTPRLREPSVPDPPDMTQALKRLTAKNRQLLLLRYDQELSINQISEIIKVKPTAVKMRLYRLRRKLKHILRSESHE